MSMNLSLNSTMLNSFNSAILNQSQPGSNFNQSPNSLQLSQQMGQLNHSYISNANYNQSVRNSHISQASSMTMQLQDSITMTCQAPVSNLNNGPSVGPISAHMNGSIPQTISNSINCVQPNLVTVKECEDGMNHPSSNLHNDRNIPFEEQRVKIGTDDGEDGLEEFPGGTAVNHHDDNKDNNDGEEEFPGGSEVKEKDDFAPSRFYDLENNEPVALTDSFRANHPHQIQRHSLYHPDLHRRNKMERRKSSILCSHLLQILENLEDDSVEESNNEENDSNTKRKFDDVEKLRDSLRESLKIDEVFIRDCKKVDRRRSKRESLVLRQSLLNSLAYPDAKKKVSSRNVETIRLPHLFHTKIDRRRSSITERSSELLKIFGPEHKAIPRKSVLQILPDVLDPASTDTLISSVLKSGSVVIDEKTLELLRELDDDDDDEDQEPTPLNGCEVNELMSSEISQLKLQIGKR